mmetsp:Transcript_20517/g.51242  ORF Transcript_20517/g.51242 Transcript_20517/m.51242 type:complete len:148 (-) Transcript_20517:89-532(-)
MSTRSSSPTAELRGLAAQAVYELPSHVVTTSSFADLAPHDFARAVDDGGEIDAYGIEQCYDAERTHSVELICENATIAGAWGTHVGCAPHRVSTGRLNSPSSCSAPRVTVRMRALSSKAVLRAAAAARRLVANGRRSCCRGNCMLSC